MADITVHSVLVCDDARREVTGKDILVGVYGSEIIVHALPRVIPLAFWIEASAHRNGPLELELKLELPSSQTAPRLKASLLVADHRIPLVFFTPQIACHIDREGELKLFLKTSTEKRFQLAKSRRIKYTPMSDVVIPGGPISTSPASPPPSEQFPPAAPV